MKQIVFNHPDVTYWVLDRAEVLSLSPSDAVSIGIVETPRKILGGVVFHNYTGRGGSITIHSAGTETNWTTRDFFWAIFDYPFNQCGVEKILGPVPADNARAMYLDLKLGFRLEAVISDVYPNGVDQFVLSMRRADCKWLRYPPRTIQPGLSQVPMLAAAQ